MISQPATFVVGYFELLIYSLNVDLGCFNMDFFNKIIVEFILDLNFKFLN